MPVALSVFILSLFLSTYLALTASHWIMMWVGMELNLLMFIPLLSFFRSGQTAESAGKYFIAQATGSSLFLLGISGSMVSTVANVGMWVSAIGLMTKAGLPPMHQWFPSVMGTLAWFPGLLLLTWQKLLPLVLLFYLVPAEQGEVLFLLGGLSALVGALGGLNQTQVRPLLAYSSIAHMGWAVSLCPFSPFVSVTYLAVCICLVVPLSLIYFLAQISSVKITSSLHQMSPPMLFVHGLLLLSLGGMPPLAGFFLKALALSTILSNNFYFFAVWMTVCATMSLAFYLNIAFLSLLTPFLSLAPRGQGGSVSVVMLYLSVLSVAGLPVLLVLIG